MYKLGDFNKDMQRSLEENVHKGPWKGKHKGWDHIDVQDLAIQAKSKVYSAQNSIDDGDYAWAIESCIDAANYLYMMVEKLLKEAEGLEEDVEELDRGIIVTREMALDAGDERMEGMIWR